eukprot:TRINITY_DN8444_c0_g1_i1.p1 TRINITY_DN8444_c0_g1~~TRINITY_DN8444_c0_g1_i1.p1  ORF type:complete len:1244 (-),score=248.17 TRINITY_DN8444_c0_g1_i1:64-3795(-)
MSKRFKKSKKKNKTAPLTLVDGLVVVDTEIVGGDLEPLVRYVAGSKNQGLVDQFLSAIFAFVGFGDFIDVLRTKIEAGGPKVRKYLKLIRRWLLMTGLFYNYPDVLDQVNQLIHNPAYEDTCQPLIELIADTYKQLDIMRGNDILEENDVEFNILYTEYEKVSRQISLFLEREIRKVAVFEFIFRDDTCPNYTNFETIINNLEQWAKTCILKETNFEDRVFATVQLMRVALACKEMKNLLAFQIIVNALSDNTITNLILTWDTIIKTYPKLHSLFMESTNLTDSGSNYKSYRKELSDLQSSDASIPFINVLVSDIKYVDKMHPDNTIAVGKKCVLNFTRIIELGSILIIIDPYHLAAPYHFNREDFIFNEFCNMHYFSQEVCAERSLELENMEVIDTTNLTRNLIIAIEAANGGIDERIRKQRDRKVFKELEDGLIMHSFKFQIKIKGGKPADIVKKFVDTSAIRIGIEESDYHSFLIFYPRFTTAREIINTLQDCFYNNVQNMPELALIVKFLTIWTQCSTYISDPDAKQLIQDFLDATFLDQGYDIPESIIEPIQNALSNLKNENTFILPHMKLIGEIPPLSLFLDSFNMEVCAEQLCLFEHQLLGKLTKEELISDQWMEDISQCPNLEKFLVFFQDFGTWVISLLTWTKFSRRSKLLLKFVILTIYLFEKGNYNSCMNLIYSLSHPYIQGMKLSWEKLKDKNKIVFDRFLDLNNLFSKRKGFYAYRQFLKSAELPCVPYMGLILRELKFIHRGFDDTLFVDGHGEIIHFEKFTRLSEILEEVKKYQDVHFTFQKSNAEYNYFAKDVIRDVENAYEKWDEVSLEEQKQKKDSFIPEFVMNKRRSKQLKGFKFPKLKGSKDKHMEAVQENVEETPKVELTPEIMTYENLPVQVIGSCRKCGINLEEAQQNPEVVWKVAMFLYPEHFKGYKFPPKGKEPDWIPKEIADQYALTIQTATAKNLKKRFKRIRVTGEGGFGAVYAVKDNNTGKNIAMKVLRDESAVDKKFNLYEICCLNLLKHENIVTYYESYSVGDEIWITMELLEGGTLGEAARFHVFSDTHIAYITREMVHGISYIHSMNYVHRDLKSANVMLTIKGGVKLIDLGLCATLEDGPREKLLGSPFWIPPEMIHRQPHSYKSDIWSLGVLVLELLLQHPPYYRKGGFRCLWATATSGLFDRVPETASDGCRNFLQLCLETDPNIRSSAAELLEHEWIYRNGLSEGIRDVIKGIFMVDTLDSLGIFN